MDWLGGSDCVKLELRKFIPHFDMLYFDFSEKSDIDIRGTVKLKAYLQLIKHIYGTDLEKIYSIIVQLHEAGELHYFETVIIKCKYCVLEWLVEVTVKFRRVFGVGVGIFCG